MSEFPNPFDMSPDVQEEAFGITFKIPEHGAASRTETYPKRQEDGSYEEVTDTIQTWNEPGQIVDLVYLEPGHDDDDPNKEQLRVKVQLCSDPAYGNTNPGQFLDMLFLDFWVPTVNEVVEQGLKQSLKEKKEAAKEAGSLADFKASPEGAMWRKFWATKFSGDRLASLLVATGHEDRLYNRKKFSGFTSILDLLQEGKLLNQIVSVVIDFGKQSKNGKRKEISSFKPFEIG